MRALPLVILGGGEHARVVAEAAVASGAWRPVGYTAPEPALGRPLLGAEGEELPWLGTDAAHAEAAAALPLLERPWLVLGFGGPHAMRRAAVVAVGPARWATVVHPRAWVSPSAAVGRGAVVLAGAIVNTGADVGDHAIVNTHAVVEHDARIGALSHVAPGATIGGGTVIGEGTVIGLGAVVRDHVRIGDRAIVAMGAVVVGDVADGAEVRGVPARVAGQASDG